MLRGIKTPEKKRVLNNIMVEFARNYRMPGCTDLNAPESFHQPNVVQLRLKHLFKIFKDNGIPFQQSEYNSFTGSYMNVWKNFFLEVAPKRADYGRCPNRAAVDMQCAYKIRNASPPFLPYQIYDDLMACLTWESSVSIMLRKEEVSLCSTSVLLF